MFLRNQNSIFNSFGDIMPLLNNKLDLPTVYFQNKNSDQYLKMPVFPEDLKNIVSQFEVIYNSMINNDVKMNTSKISSFLTENNVFLGLTKSSLIDIKGKNYKVIIDGNYIILKYLIEDFDNSIFLK